MNVAKTLKSAAVMALAGVLSVSVLAGCSGNGNAVAATVNGVDITEQQVTDYIQNFRTQSGYGDEDAWGQWMSAQGLDPASVRQEVVDYFAGIELVKKAAAENDITVSDDDVNAQVESMKSRYDGDEAWQTALSQAGTTEEKYRESIKTAMMEQALQEKVGADASEPTDEEMLQYAQMYASYYDGYKRSSHILFAAEDTETAQSVLDQINAGTLDFAEAAKQYSTDTGSAANGGDVGWGISSSFVTEYSDALANLEVGQVSDLVNSQYGIHIIKCTDQFHAPETITDISQVPDELATAIRSMLEQQGASTAYQTWFEQFKTDNAYTTSDMPAGLPYDLDMSKYPADTTSSDSSVASSTDAATTDAASSSSEASSTDAAATDAAATDAAATDAASSSSEASSSSSAS